MIYTFTTVSVSCRCKFPKCRQRDRGLGRWIVFSSGCMCAKCSQRSQVVQDLVLVIPWS